MVEEEITELITLDQVKEYLKINNEDWDNILTLMIPAAIKKTEDHCGRKWLEQEIEETRIGEGIEDIALNWAPASEVESVTVDEDETEDFTLRSGIARLHRDRHVWPAGAVIVITYTAGYGEVEDVNAAVPEVVPAILETIADWYNNPLGASSMNLGGVGSISFDDSQDIPQGVKRKLSSLRRRFF